MGLGLPFENFAVYHRQTSAANAESHFQLAEATNAEHAERVVTRKLIGGKMLFTTCEQARALGREHGATDIDHLVACPSGIKKLRDAYATLGRSALVHRLEKSARHRAVAQYAADTEPGSIYRDNYAAAAIERLENLISAIQTHGEPMAQDPNDSEWESIHNHGRQLGYDAVETVLHFAYVAVHQVGRAKARALIVRDQHALAALFGYRDEPQIGEFLDGFAEGVFVRYDEKYAKDT
jgi:hypothetical protein